MIDIYSELGSLFSAAFIACGADPLAGTIMRSERPDLGQFQCNGALAAAKSLSLPPRELAEKVLDALPENSIIKETSVAGPGFINIVLDDEYLARHAHALASDERGGIALDPNAQKAFIDFGGPNIAKPLAVHHLRTFVIGDCLQRLYRFHGYDLTSDIHTGDWGTQMGMLICAVQDSQPDLPYFDVEQTDGYPAEAPITVADLEAMYPAASARYKEDAGFKSRALEATRELQNKRPGYLALWQHFVDLSLATVKEDVKTLDIHFDLWYGESHYNDRIPAMVERLKQGGFAIESQGATIVPLPPHHGKEIPPLLLLKSDGAYLYSTTDLAGVDERLNDDKATLLIYLADQRQSLHFQQVFAAAKLSGIAPAGTSLVHLGFGTVNSPDGKPFKTRSGGTMKLSDLIEAAKEKALERMEVAGVAKEYEPAEMATIVDSVAIAALKFAELSNNRSTDYIFDLDKFVSFEGRTGPYLIYTAVRIKSIFRKLSFDRTAGTEPLPAADAERPLLLQLANFPNAMRMTMANGTPHILCEHLFELAQDYNRFYASCNISEQENDAIRQSWLSLSSLCLKQLELGLSLLGISVPERM